MHPSPPPPKPAFRWGRGLLHAAIALVIIIAAFGVLAVTLPVADPHRFGEGVGRFSFFMALGALGVSALAQTGRRVAAWLVGGLLTVLVLGLAVVLLAVAPERGAEAQARPLPTDDLVRADGVLRHPSLGVSIPDPGAGLQLAPELVPTTMKSAPGHRAWVYADPEAGEVVFVILGAGMAKDEPTFADYFRGVASAYASPSSSDRAVVERERWLRWDERRAHLYVVSGDVVHMHIDVFALPGGEAFGIVTAAANAERFAALASGVKTP